MGGRKSGGARELQAAPLSPLGQRIGLTREPWQVHKPKRTACKKGLLQPEEVWAPHSRDSSVPCPLVPPAVHLISPHTIPSGGGRGWLHHLFLSWKPGLRETMGTGAGSSPKRKGAAPCIQADKYLLPTKCKAWR